MEQAVYQYSFNKVAVLGAGVMGSQIAAHFANSNIPVVMLDQDDFANKALISLAKQTPPPLATTAFADRIITGNYDNDLGLLKECDLVIEAIVEDIAIKKQFFNTIIPHLRDDAVIASNTSGLSINALADILPEERKKNFFGVHFFNPPRFMPLLELIPSRFSDKQQLSKLEGFLTSYLGKEIVYAKDSPGFIANRVGVFALLITIHHGHRLGISPDNVDALTGTLIGKAKSATYRTADVVGLDILKNVVDHIKQSQPDDPWNDYFVLPDWMETLIANGHLGSKTKQGIYKKQGKHIYVFDAETNDYRLQDKNIDKALFKQIKKSKHVLADIAQLYQTNKDNKYVDFLWSINRDMMLYCAHHITEIANSIGDVDRALKAGFNWNKGVFELWQKAGIDKINQLIKQDISVQRTLTDTPLPKWLDDHVQFYNTNKESLVISKKTFEPVSKHPVYDRQIDIENYDVLIKTDDVCLRKVTDGIAVIHFLTPMNVLSYQVLVDINSCLDYLENNGYFSLIFASTKAGVFCAGANLFEVLSACKLSRIDKAATTLSKAKQKAFELANPDLPKLKYQGSLTDVVALGQRLVMRMKHGSIYVIAAVDGLALGGGCEFVLHSNHVVASLNSYIGLVEVGVGVLPAFGGCKEMILRSNLDKYAREKSANQYFEQIAMAKVASSAYEAIDMGYLQKHTTSVVANPKELLFTAIEHAKKAMTEPYMAEQKSLVMPMGESGKANLLSVIANMKEGNFISEHDELIAGYVAEIFSGQVSDTNKVSQDYILGLERERFIALVRTQKTQDCIEHMLKKSKPLRN